MGVGGDFGWSVALSADGSTAIVGGPTDDKEQGAAWLFARTQPKPGFLRAGS